MALGTTQRRRPVHLGGGPHRPHAVSRTGGTGGGALGPLVPRGGRLPVDVLHRHRLGLAGLDGRGLAHRQPTSRTPRLRPGTGAPRRGPGPQAAALGADRLRRGRGAGRDRRATRTPIRRRRRHRDPRPSLRGRGVGCGPRLPGPPRHQHDVVDQLSRAHEEDRRRAPDHLGPGADAGRIPGRRQPRRRRAVPAVAARQRPVRPRPRRGHRHRCWCGHRYGHGHGHGHRTELRRPRRRGGGGRSWKRRSHVHTVARRRALTGGRPQGPGRFPQPLTRRHPGTHGARRPRGRGVQQPVAPRCRRALRQAPARPPACHRGWRHVGPVVPDPRRRHGTRHRARHRAAARQPARGGHVRRAGPRRRHT